MTRVMTLAMVLGLLAASAGQAQDAKSPYDAVVQDMIAATDKITSILATIKDSTSAQAARPELKKAVGKFLEVRKRADKLTQPDRKERDRISRTYAKKLQDAVERNKEERTRVAGVAGGRDALRELDALEPPEPSRPPAKKK
jgi:hypothetical protein